MPFVAVAGFAVALAAVSPLFGFAFAFASGRSAVKYLPTGILLSMSNGSSREIALELESRVTAKALQQDQLDRVVDRVIEMQGDWKGPWDPAWADVYEAAAMSAGGISKERKDRWIAQSLNLKAKPRPFVNSRDPVVLRVQSDGVRINPSGSGGVNVSFESFTVDGVDVLTQITAGEKPNTKVYFGVAGAGRRGQSADISRDMFVRLPAKAPGTYPFVATLLLQQASGGGSTGASDFSRRQTIQGTITVRPDGQPTVTPEIPTAGDVDQVRQFLAMKEVVLCLSGWSTSATGVITPNQWSFVPELPWNQEPRIPLAFQVWLIDADGHRVKLGRLASESYEDNSGVSSSTPRMETHIGAQSELRGPVSLVFQPDAQIAKETFGLLQYFGEEIRMDNLPLWWSPEYGGRRKFATPQEAVQSKQQSKTP